MGPLPRRAAAARPTGAATPGHGGLGEQAAAEVAGILAGVVIRAAAMVLAVGLIRVRGVGSVTWVDGQGEAHMGGWPSCLSVPGTTHRIKFGYVPVTLPDGSGFRQVVWADCRA